ncbi:hypothetical protein D3C74_491790 [compost metagenome]
MIDLCGECLIYKGGSMNTELRNTMQNTIDRFVSPNAEILSIKDQDLLTAPQL